MGPIAIQVRRGAEVLGYDPNHLTDQQRGMVEVSLQDPAQNVFTASEYLAQLKAESEFANVPAEEMTPARCQELAARDNGGPYWRTDAAQAGGRTPSPRSVSVRSGRPLVPVTSEGTWRSMREAPRTPVRARATAAAAVRVAGDVVRKCAPSGAGCGDRRPQRS